MFIKKTNVEKINKEKQSLAVGPRNTHFYSPGVVRRSRAAALQVRALVAGPEAAAAGATGYRQLYD